MLALARQTFLRSSFLNIFLFFLCKILLRSSLGNNIRFRSHPGPRADELLLGYNGVLLDNSIEKKL